MIEITEQPIEVEKIIASTHTPKAGGHVHFVGTVREEGDLKGLFYECYPPMAERVLRQIVSEVGEKWSVEKIAVVHRHGWVPLGEASVVVAVSSAHRREAFAACQYVMDQIKERVPIWKYENGEHKNFPQRERGILRCLHDE